MAPDPSPRRLRPAVDSDVLPLAELWAYAFPGERTVEERVRGLREGGEYGGLEECVVAEVGGRMAGALRTYRLKSWILGRCHDVLGLAAVAVAPEFRRRGVGRWMCEEALRIGYARGDALSYLFPFRVSFYADLGYTLAGELHRYRFPPEALPLFSGWERVARAAGEEGKEARQVYRRVTERSNGLLERTARMWRFQPKEGLTTLLYRDGVGSARGYAIVSPAGRASGERASGHRSTMSSVGRDGSLQVRELLAEDAEAYRALLGWISAQRDQWREVTYDALPSEQFHRLLPHPQRPGSGRARALWFPSASILRGPMVRVLNVEKVLGDLVEVPVRIDDPILPGNDGVWAGGRKREERGGASSPSSAAPGTPAPRKLSIAEFTERFLAGGFVPRDDTAGFAGDAASGATSPEAGAFGAPPSGAAGPGGAAGFGGDFRLLDTF